MHGYLLPALSLGPQALRTLIRSIPSEKWDIATGTNRFTPREVMAHLADWEELFRTRMEVARSSPGSPVEVFDEGQRAEELGYRKTDPNVQADLFVQRREQTRKFLESLSSEEWHLHYQHPERGKMSIEDTANMLVGHDMYHVEQLIQLMDVRTAGTW
jgi:hypothetical protein